MKCKLNKIRHSESLSEGREHSTKVLEHIGMEPSHGEMLKVVKSDIEMETLILNSIYFPKLDTSRFRL